MVRRGENVEVVEWDDMNKASFYMYGIGLSFTTRLIIYPTQLIKTRLQGQTKGTGGQYNGMKDALVKIYRVEGVRGFYKGLHLNLMQVPMAQVYLTVFEKCKQQLSKNFPNGNIPATYFIAGGVASTVSQVIATPLDVIAQYQQVGASSNVAANKNITSKRTLKICSQLYQTDGLRGFYRGFTVATVAFSINSALIWTTYYNALELTGRLPLFTTTISNLANQSNSSTAALAEISPSRALQIMISGTCSSCLINMALLPMDTIRTRHQLQLKRGRESKAQQSVWRTLSLLWQEEGAKGLWRGWSPRLAQAISTSGILFLSYEYLKTMAYRKQLQTSGKS